MRNLYRRDSQKLSSPVCFRWIEVNGEKQNTWLCLDTSPFFLHIATKLVQALVIVYNKIFQALVVEGDVLLLSKPLLDLSFDSVWGDQVGAVWWVGSSFQMSGICTIHGHSLSAVLSQQESDKSSHLFPCMFIQWGLHYPVDAVPVLHFLHWWLYWTM